MASPPATITPPAPPRPSRASALSPATLVPLGLTVAFGWWLVIRVHEPQWSATPQAELGALIPWFCLILLYLRWADRPIAAPPSRGLRALAATVGFASILGLAAIQPIFEANSDWRPPAQAAALGGVTATLALFTFIGGTPYLRHFGFPVLLFLAATPWPWRFEKIHVQQNLMEFNATLCVEVLQWLGFEATKQGSLIALPTGVLEVEEACSGIRSLQASLALALVAGEVCRSTARIRFYFVLLALFVALLGNAVRIFVLAILASTRGPAAIDNLHDPAGYAILAATLTAIIIASAWCLRRYPPPTPPPSVDRPPVTLPTTVAFRASLLGVGAFLFASLVGTEAWYRSHETEPLDRSNAWTFAPSPDEDRASPMADRTLEMLMHPDVVVSERWSDDAGLDWQVFHFRWEPDQSAIHAAMVVHDPRVCLGTVGLTLEATLPDQTLTAAGFRIPFHHFRFTGQRRILEVFHAVVKDDQPFDWSDETIDNLSRYGRLRAVFEGRRNRGLTVLEVILSSPDPIANPGDKVRVLLDRRLIPRVEPEY